MSRSPSRSVCRASQLDERLAEGVLSFGFEVSQNDSAAKIANSLDDHHKRLILVFCLCILYVAGFVVYLTRLDDLLRRASNERRFLRSDSAASSPTSVSRSTWSGFLLVLIFVLASSVIGLTRRSVTAAAT